MCKIVGPLLYFTICFNFGYFYVGLYNVSLLHLLLTALFLRSVFSINYAN